MEDLNSILQNLIDEIVKNFSFFIPYDALAHENTQRILNFYNLKVTDEIIDNYIDKLLYFDEDLKIKVLESYDIVVGYNALKASKLDNNCFQLVHLKDTKGKATFKLIFTKYIEQVVIYSTLCDMLIGAFYESYSDTTKNPTFLFEQQKKILQKHLNDIESNIGVKGGNINEDEIIGKLINSSVAKPYIKEQSDTPVNFVNNEAKSDAKKPVVIKPFREFIVHKNNIEIEEIIKKHFSDHKGISLRYLIEYLKERRVLLLIHGDQTKIHSSFKALFETEDIGALSSIFGVKVFNADINYLKSKDVFGRVLDKLTSFEEKE
ncbi:hypothetical protein [Flavobacterium sp.]